jgi:amidase
MVNPDTSALDLSRAIHRKQVSCQEVMRSTLERIARLNPQSNAIVSLQEPERLMAQARERDAQLARGESMGWMHGMPQAIKDLANAQGLRTTLGSPLMKDFVASEDGLMTRRMKAAGAIVIGKTNTPEFGLGSHTFNEVFGPTRNAWNPGKSAGGSSGGAAVALAQRLLSAAGGRRLGFHGQPAQPRRLEPCVRHAPLTRACAHVTRARRVHCPAGHRRPHGPTCARCGHAAVCASGRGPDQPARPER